MWRFVSPKPGRRHDVLRVVAFLAAGWIVAVPAHPQDAEDPFESVFGASQPAVRPLPTPTLIDGRLVGTAGVYPPAEGLGPRIASDDLLSLVESFLAPSANDTLTGISGQLEYVAESDLMAMGISLEYDENRLELHILIPGRLRRVQSLSARGTTGARRSSLGAEAIRSAPFSGYINAVANAQIISSVADEGVQTPIALSLEPVLQIREFVGEGSVRFTYDGAFAVSPAYVRVVRDLPGSAIRLSAGDTLYRTTGFQVRVPLQGIAVDREFDLSPERQPGPNLAQEITLDFPSSVRVLINGRETFRTSLPAGRYSIRDFPVATGLNTVTVEITEPDGTVKRIEIEAPFDSNLLAAGTHGFSYAVGVPPFSLGVPRISGFHRIGVTDRLSLGANVQTDFAMASAGLGALWASRLGVMHFDVAGSVSETELGGAASIQYQYRRPGQERIPSIGAYASYTSEKFATIAGQAVQPGGISTRISMSHRLGATVGINLAVGALFEPAASRATPGASLSLTSSPFLGSNLGMSLSMNLPSDGELAWEGRFRFSSAGIGRPTSISYTQDLREGVGAVQVQIPRTQPTRSYAGSLGLSGNITDRASPVTVNGAADFIGRRMVAVAGARGTRIPERDVQFLSSFQLAGALAFAGGSLAMSRPINGSFAIIDRIPKYRGIDVGVNPSRSGFEAVADALGPAVLPNLQPYTVSRVHVEASSLPIGYDLGPSSYDLWAGYGTGHRITVGTQATVFVTGRIVDDGPVVLQAGRIVSAEGGSDIEFFTNRDGRFSAFGLVPGTYTIRIGGKTSNRFAIPSDAEGLVQLGELGVTE